MGHQSIKRKNTSELQRMTQKIKDILPMTDNLLEIVKASSVFNEAHIWSLKKLLLLKDYLKPYLNIISQRVSTNCFYLDLFSGSGASKTKEGYRFIGSPLISLLYGAFYVESRNNIVRFKKWIFIEKDSKRCNALRKRVDITVGIKNEEIKGLVQETKIISNNDILIMCGDCNEKINKIITLLEKYEGSKACLLAFVDPEGFTDIRWETWRRLLKLRYVDILFVLPTSGFKRNLSHPKIYEYLPPLNEGQKQKILDRSITCDDFVDIYAEGIRDIVGRTIRYYYKPIVRISEGAELYRIIPFTHSEGATNAIEKIVNMLDKLSSKQLETIIEQCLDRQKKLFENM